VFALICFSYFILTNQLVSFLVYDLQDLIQDHLLDYPNSEEERLVMKVVTVFSVAALAAMAVAPVQATPIGVLALYQFEDGDARDTSGNSNDGTTAAGISYVNDATRGAVAQSERDVGLSGIDTGLNINPGVMPNLTMGGWFKRTGPSPWTISPTMMSHDDGFYDRELSFDSRLGFGGPGGSADYSLTAYGGSGTGVVNSGVVPLDDQWFHAAVSYDGASVRLYLGGVEIATGNDTTDSGSSGNTLWLGTNPGFNEDFLGLMDDVFVYDRTLAADEILDIAENGFDRASGVPLPTSLSLLLAGLGGLSLSRRKRR
jgi:hypothetical protein